MPAPRFLGKPLIRMGAVTSTMDIARRLESLGAPEGVAVLAASQTHGRGRSDRTWQSPPNAGIYCSILLRPNLPVDKFQPFSIVAGLALCEALDPDQSLSIQLKWPNDLIVAGRKLAGILVTSNLTGEPVSSAILGFGINLQPNSTQPSTAIAFAEIASSQTSLIPRLIRALSDRYAAICAGNSELALLDWPDRLAYLGQPVLIQDGSTQHAGIIHGLDHTGALVIEASDGPLLIFSGELTRGPRPIDR